MLWDSDDFSKLSEDSTCASPINVNNQGAVSDFLILSELGKGGLGRVNMVRYQLI
jgi:hypothetical protein